MSLRNASGVGRSTVILDETQRKPLVRFNFLNKDSLEIEIFGANKERMTYKVSSIEDIFNHAESIRISAQSYNATGII